MPFAKAVLTRRRYRDPVNGTGSPQVAYPPPSKPPEEQSEDLKDADRLFHDDLVSIGRQLSALVLLAGQIFDELCGEYRLIGDRTDRISSKINGLSGKVYQLDAKGAEIPESTISTVASLARHFETDYAYHGLAIFDPSNRPLSVQALYGAAVPTPVGHLRECDSYRTDDLRGAQIFSRIPIALNKWTDDLLSIAKARQKITFLPKSRTCRPLQLGLEAKSLPNILQTGSESRFHKGGNDIKAFESSQDVFRNRERSSSPSVTDDLHLSPVLMVNIDVSGSSFNQLCKLHAPSNAYEVPDGTSTTTSLRRRDKFLTRPKTITGISDLVFHEIDIDPPALKHSRSVKSRNSPRNPLNKTMSQTLEIYAPKERRTPKDLKRRTTCFDEGDEPKSCGSWRHSLKSVFRISRSKSRDLWNVTSPTTEDVTSKKSDNLSTLKRSMSLPRSLKSSTKHSAASFGSFRSSSVEGRLNFRVIQMDKPVNTANSSASKSPKPVAGERLGRSLTKSLSQVRIGQSSRNRKSFDVPCRPQSMEIRMPSVDEEGRPLLSLYNNASVTNFSSSIATVKSSSISDHPWMKSLSVIKLRHNENKEQKDDCQSSSGRWSGSSGLTEKQVVLESDITQPTSLGSATLIGQCPSEMSVNIKDSAMCLHYNPNDSSFAPIDETSDMNTITASREKTEKFRIAVGGVKNERETEQNNDNAFVERKVSRKSFISSNSLTRALSVGRKKSAQQSSRSGSDKAQEIIHSQSRHTDEINDEDCFPQKLSGDEFAISQSAKSESSKPKITYRSSFMLKLKKLGKSSKAETPPSSVASRPAVRPTTMLTMGDCISQASKETGRSMTPSLPPGESNELRKLGELADRLAAAKAKVSCTGALSSSLSSSSSSGSCITWNKDSLQPGKSSQSLVLGEVNQLLHRGAFSALPSSPNDKCDFSDRYNCSPTFKSQGYFSFPNVKHFGFPDGTNSEVSSTSADPPVSPTKLELRASIKGLKMTELESILETSHECETTSPYLTRSKMAAVVNGGNGIQVNMIEQDAHSDQSSTNDCTDSIDCENNMPSPHAKLPTTDQPVLLSPATADLVESPLVSESGSLVPATARLIISSPVASRAFFINNPFKRSLCQPLSAEDFTKLCAGDLELHESPSPDGSHFTYPEVTKASLDVLKHSAAFPVMIRERVDPSNYGRSWYDGISCDPLVPLVDAGEPKAMQGLSHPAFGLTNHSTNPNLRSKKDQTIGSLGYQSQTLLTTQKPDTAFYRIPCHSFSTTSPTTYDSSPNKANGQSIGQKGLEVSNVKSSQIGQTGLGKKCAHVVFPSSNSGILLSQSNHQTASKSTRTLQGDQKPRSTVNLLHLKTFRGADDTNMPLPSNGGQAFRSDLVWPNCSAPNATQGVKCNTLPRLHLKTFPESVPTATSHHLDLKCTSSYKY